MSQLFEEMMQGLVEADAYMEGERKGFTAHVPESVDVKGLRGKLRMSQAQFSSAFGFSVDAVRHWESKRRTPEASARAFLKVIEFNPEMVVTALARVGGSASPIRSAAKGTTAPGKKNRQAPGAPRFAAAGAAGSAASKPASRSTLEKVTTRESS